MKKILLALLIILPLLLSGQQVIDLSSWNANLTITGSNAYDSFGKSIAKGDLNGDGIEDMLIGAPNSDPLGRNSAGSCYLIFGEEQLPQESIINLSQEDADLEVYGANSNDKLGYSCFIANINGDSYDDLILAAPYATSINGESSGIVYIIFGSSNLSEQYDLSNNEFDTEIFGENENDNLGLSISALNFNGDQFEDLVLSAPNADHSSQLNCGKNYVIFGSFTIPSQFNLMDQDADLVFIGENYNDKTGEVLSVGNYNGDGFEDLMISSLNHDSNSIENSGKIYIIKGRTTFSNYENSLLNSQYLSSVILGNTDLATIGKSSAFGDLDFDGKDDILFSSNNGSGNISVFYGSTELPAELNLASVSPDILITGPSYNSTFGDKILVEDLNSDQFNDVLIAIPEADTDSGVDSGIIMILYGSADLGNQINLNDISPDITIFGSSNDDKLGSSIAVLNINNNNKSDIAIGAIEGANNKGAVYTIFGDLPYIVQRNPQPESYDNDIDQIVTFSIADRQDGIDLQTLNVLIAGTEYNSDSPNLSFSGNEYLYEITIIPDQAFGYNQEVDVTINCDDLDGWHLPTDIYRFFTIADVDPPFTDLWNPAPDSLGVPVDTDITFHIYDLGEGVDLNSITVDVQGITYYLGHPGFTSSGSPNDFYISIDPSLDFFYGEVVNVSIDGADLSDPPNQMTTFSYNFTCGLDDVPPFVYSWDPEFQEEVPYNHPLRIEVRDLESGVNLESINLMLDDVDITSQSAIQPNNIGNGYIITYTPSEGNYYSYDEHSLFISCEDNAFQVNSVDSTSTFICIEDVNMPYTENHIPARFETNVATNTIFQVDIVDDFTGINSSSISVTINSEEIIGLNNTNIIPINGGYRVYHDPENPMIGTINITIDASDNSLPPNQMPTDSYSFNCSLDDDAPYMINLNPAQDAENVPVNQNVYLELKDNKTGIDYSSIILIIDDIDVTSNTTISIISQGYSLFYASPEDFHYADIVDVEVSFSDLAITPNDVVENYQFTIESDLESPYVRNEDPEPGAVAVPLDSNIYFEVVDDGVGVDSTSIQVFFNGDLITPMITAMSNGNGYEIFYDPINDFQYSDVVEISISAQDIANPPNSMINYSYSFSCVDEDIDPPFLRGIQPSPNSNNISVFTSISFEVLDEESGINENSIIFKVNNSILENDDYSLNSVSYGDTTGFFLQYQSPEPYQFGETIHVQFYAKDGSSNDNELLENFSFTCEEDTLAPQLVELFPQPDSSGYPNTVLFFRFIDEQAGIDSSSFVLRIDNILITNYLANYSENEMEILYDPVGFLEPDLDLQINVQLDDFLGNHQDTTYSITIIPDEFSPYLLPIKPQPNSFTIGLQDTVKLDILDKGMGLDQNTLIFKINGSVEENYQLIQNPYSYNPDSLGVRLFYRLNEDSYYEGQQVTITIEVEDVANPANYLEESYLFHIKRDIKDDVEAVPNILTLNGDHYNDICNIWIDTDKPLIDIKGSIYGRDGNKIISLTPNIESSNRKYLIWDGKDKTGRLVRAGLYIYQVKIGSKTYQGSIVVAR